MENYQELFDTYVGEMRAALANAGQWWAHLQARDGLTDAEGRPDRPTLAERWPFGAVSHPFVIDCYRRWSLACEALNDQLEADEDEDEDDGGEGEASWGRDDPPEQDVDLGELEPPVESRELLIGMLPGRADDLAEALALFVFDPVGMDKDDRLV